MSPVILNRVGAYVYIYICDSNVGLLDYASPMEFRPGGWEGHDAKIASKGYRSIYVWGMDQNTFDFLILGGGGFIKKIYAHGWVKQTYRTYPPAECHKVC